MNARYYDPVTGRFISQDTYRGDGEAFWHLYLYCDGDPVNNVDLTGHASYMVKALLASHSILSKSAYKILKKIYGRHLTGGYGNYKFKYKKVNQLLQTTMSRQYKDKNGVYISISGSVKFGSRKNMLNYARKYDTGMLKDIFDITGWGPINATKWEMGLLC